MVGDDDDGGGDGRRGGRTKRAGCVVWAVRGDVVLGSGHFGGEWATLFWLQWAESQNRAGHRERERTGAPLSRGLKEYLLDHWKLELVRMRIRSSSFIFKSQPLQLSQSVTVTVTVTVTVIVTVTIHRRHLIRLFGSLRHPHRS